MGRVESVVAPEGSLIAQNRPNGLARVDCVMSRRLIGCAEVLPGSHSTRNDDFYRRFDLVIVRCPEGLCPMDHPIGIAGITCRNGSRSKSYWTKTSRGIKLVNALSEESVGQSNHGLEANPTTDSSLKPSRGECSPASRSLRAGFPDLLLSRHPKVPEMGKPVRQNC
jgi:hypothetical protein